MIVEEFVVTLFQQNCRIVVCPATLQGMCIDPGAFTREIADFIAKGAVTLQAIALTHGHLDHVGGVNEMKLEYPEAEIILHPGERALYDALPLQPAMIGFPAEQLDAIGMKFEQPVEPEREWKDGNSRWDIIDLARMCYALRPQGLNWPSEAGKPSFKLVDLTAANKVAHSHAHDALSDVHATIAFARLLKRAQPRLWDFYFGLRRKAEAFKYLDYAHRAPVLHVSSRYPAERGCAAMVVLAEWATHQGVA